MATFYDKLNNVITLISDKTGISNIVPGSMAYQIAQAIAYESYLQEQKLENESINNSILTATGVYLDNIGDNFFGVKRKKEIKPYVSSSMQTLKFYTSGNRNFGAINKNNNITIPIGTVIYGESNGSTVRFITNEEIILYAADYEGYVSATLSQGTSNIIQSNTLVNHTFTNYTDINSNSLLITNVYPIITGREREDDEEYRYRIKNALRNLNQASISGILNVVRSVEGVSDAKIYAAKDGAGTFTVYVQGITPITSDEVITNVELTLYQECATPWVNFNVVKPDYIGLSIGVSLTLISNNSVTNASQFEQTIRNNIESYINNFTGTKFYITDLQRKILDSNSNIADVDITSFKIYRGSDEFRESETIDVTSTAYIEAMALEKIVVEPINDAIIVNIT